MAYDSLLVFYKKRSTQEKDIESQKIFNEASEAMQKNKQMSHVRNMGVCLKERGNKCTEDTECSTFRCREGICQYGKFGEFMHLIGKGTLNTMIFMVELVVGAASGSRRSQSFDNK